MIDAFSRFRTARFTACLAVCGALWLPIAAEAEVPAPDDAARQAGAMRVYVEVLAVDGKGTRSAGEAEADVFTGQTGVLRRSVSLSARGDGSVPDEVVSLVVRVTLLDDPATFCPLHLETEARGAGHSPLPPSGSPRPERRTMILKMEPEETRIKQAYISPSGRGRIALKVWCAVAVPADIPPWGIPSPEIIDPERVFDFEISFERAEGDRPPRLLRTDRVSSTLGRDVSSLFARNEPLPDGPEGEKRYRRERITVRIAPQIVSGGRLQIDVDLEGEVATLDADGPIARHPLQRGATFVMISGERHNLEVSVRSSDEAEGWSVVQYVVQVTGRF